MIEIKYSGDELWARIERAVEKLGNDYNALPKRSTKQMCPTPRSAVMQSNIGLLKLTSLLFGTLVTLTSL